MQHDIGPERTHLDRLRLAAEVILSESDSTAVNDALQAELTIFKDRIKHALLECGGYQSA